MNMFMSQSITKNSTVYGIHKVNILLKQYYKDTFYEFNRLLVNIYVTWIEYLSTIITRLSVPENILTQHKLIVSRSLVIFFLYLKSYDKLKIKIELHVRKYGLMDHLDEREKEIQISLLIFSRDLIYIWNGFWLIYY